jgi:pimeloyl-ACP methyl ester carboxylesterase
MAFAQHASADEARVLAAVQRPISVACIGTKAARPLWMDRPSWYLLAEQDRMINPETQRFMAARMNAKVISHQVDHTPSVTAPQAVADLVIEAVRSVTDNSGHRRV